MQQSTSDLRIVLIGKTGQGKSTLGNKILGVDQEVFKVGRSLHSETVVPSSKTFTWPYNQNLKVDLVDTPGLADNSGEKELSDEKILEQLEDYVKGLKEGFNMALFCWHGRQRFDRTDLDELQMIGDMLTAKVFHNIWICVTQLDDMKPEARDKIVNNIKNQLPELFDKNGIDIPAENLLVSDFEDFENSMMKPIDKILKTSTFYKMPEEKSSEFDPFTQGILSKIKLWQREEAEIMQQFNNSKLSLKRREEKEKELESIRKQMSFLKNYIETYAPHHIAELLTNEMNKQGFQRMPFQSSSPSKNEVPLNDNQVLAYYFSARWCSASTRFTLRLAELYNIWNEDEKTIEIVFLSGDENKQEYERHLQQMPWKALPFGDPKIDQLERKFNVQSYPTLCIVSKDGRETCITIDGAEDVYYYGIEAIEEWIYLLRSKSPY